MGFSAIGKTDILRVILAGEDIWPVEPNEPYYLALHVGNPGDNGTQATNEAAYTGYKRIGVLRSSDSWVLKNGRGSNCNRLSFPKAESEERITHISLGAEQSGPGYLVGTSQLPKPLLLSPGIIPTFSSGDLNIALNNALAA